MWIIYNYITVMYFVRFDDLLNTEGTKDIERAKRFINKRDAEMVLLSLHGSWEIKSYE